MNPNSFQMQHPLVHTQQPKRFPFPIADSFLTWHFFGYVNKEVDVISYTMTMSKLRERERERERWFWVSVALCLSHYSAAKVVSYPVIPTHLSRLIKMTLSDCSIRCVNCWVCLTMSSDYSTMTSTQHQCWQNTSTAHHHRYCCWLADIYRQFHGSSFSELLQFCKIITWHIFLCFHGVLFHALWKL